MKRALETASSGGVTFRYASKSQSCQHRIHKEQNGGTNTVICTDGKPSVCPPRSGDLAGLSGRVGQTLPPLGEGRHRPLSGHTGRRRNEIRRRFLKRDSAAFFYFVMLSGRSPMRSGAALKRLMPYRFSRIRIVSGNRESSFLPKTVEPK